MDRGMEKKGKEKTDSEKERIATVACLRRRRRSTFSSSLCTKNLRNNKERGRNRGGGVRKGEETKGTERYALL